MTVRVYVSKHQYYVSIILDQRTGEKRSIWALFLSYLHNALWWVNACLNPRLFCICRLQKGLFPALCRLPKRDYQREETGFQVRTLRLCYRLVPGEAALGSSAGGKLPLTRVREASRLAWRSGIPLQLTFGGISERWMLGLKNLVVVDCSYIKS